MIRYKHKLHNVIIDVLPEIYASRFLNCTCVANSQCFEFRTYDFIHGINMSLFEIQRSKKLIAIEKGAFFAVEQSYINEWWKIVPVISKIADSNIYEILMQMFASE